MSRKYKFSFFVRKYFRSDYIYKPLTIFPCKFFNFQFFLHLFHSWLTYSLGHTNNTYLHTYNITYLHTYLHIWLCKCLIFHSLCSLYSHIHSATLTHKTPSHIHSISYSLTVTHTHVYSLSFLLTFIFIPLIFTRNVMV